MSEKLVIIEIGNPQSLIQREKSPTSELINTENLFLEYFRGHGFFTYNGVRTMFKNIDRADCIEFCIFIRLLSDNKSLRFYIGEIGNLYIDAIELFETQDWNKVINAVNLLSS